MKKYLILSLCVAAMMTGCKGGQTTSDADVDSAEIDSTAVETAVEAEEVEVLMPSFIYYFNKDNMQVVYWTLHDAPEKPADDDEYKDWYNEALRSWKEQDMLLRNADKYNRMYVSGDRYIKVKFLEERYINPDGELYSMGQLHCATMPSAGLRYTFADPQEKLKSSEWGELYLLVAEEYLQTREIMPVKTNIWSSTRSDKPFPKEVVKQLEEEYGMKAQRSHISALLGERYKYGTVQFKAKDDKALALEVITEGDKVYSYPVEGYYEPGYGHMWNVDDEGIYLPSDITMAFDGPEGPELCYIHHAPESCTTGHIYIRDGKLVKADQSCYYVNIDEGYAKPLWKEDKEKYVKAIVEYDPEYKNYDLNCWAYIDIDKDGTDEIWLKSYDPQVGAILSIKDTPTVLCTTDSKIQASLYQGAILVSGSCGGPCIYTQIITMKNSKKVATLEYTACEGEVDTYTCDGEEISEEVALNFKSNALKKEHDRWPTFHSSNN